MQVTIPTGSEVYTAAESFRRSVAGYDGPELMSRVYKGVTSLLFSWTRRYVDPLAAELQAQKGRADSLQAELSAARAENARLKRAVAGAQVANERLRAGQIEAASTISSLRKEIVDSVPAPREPELVMSVSELKSKACEALRELLQLAGKAPLHLEAERADAAQVRQAHADLFTEVEELSRANVALQAEVNSLRSFAGTLASRVERLTREKRTALFQMQQLEQAMSGHFRNISKSLGWVA